VVAVVMIGSLIMYRYSFLPMGGIKNSVGPGASMLEGYQPLRNRRRALNV
jgi:hypothetical protein